MTLLESLLLGRVPESITPGADAAHRLYRYRGWLRYVREAHRRALAR